MSSFLWSVRSAFGFFYVCVCMSSCSSSICWKHYPPSILLPSLLCQRSFDCICVGMSLVSLCCPIDWCVYSSTNSHRNMYFDVQSSYLHNHPEWKQCKCPVGEWINKLWNIHSNKKKWTIDSYNNLNKFQRHWGSEMKLSYLHLLQPQRNPKYVGIYWMLCRRACDLSPRK